MRILHFYGHQGANGVTSYISDVSRRLRERGHTLGVLCRADCVLRQESGSKTYQYIGGLHRWHLQRYLAQLLQQTDMLIVHSQRDAEVALQCARVAGIPSCYVVHELSHNAGDLSPVADSVIAVSAGVGGFLQQTYAPAHLYIVPNGIDFATLPTIPRDEIRREYSFAKDEIWLGFVGRITSNKNLHGLIQALGMIADEAPQLHLAVLGAGKLERQARKMATATGLGERVRFMGWRPRAETMRIVAALDIFVFPSLEAEGLSISLLQAMALGVPPLVVDIPSLVGGPVQDGVTGWLCPAGDPTTLAATIGTLAKTNTVQRQTIGQVARDIAYQKHRIELVVDAIETMAHETIQRGLSL